MRFNLESGSIEECVVISNYRFAELVQKEERLAIIERMVANGKYVSVGDIKTVLGIEETEGVNGEK